MGFSTAALILKEPLLVSSKTMECIWCLEPLKSYSLRDLTSAGKRKERNVGGKKESDSERHRYKTSDYFLF